MTLHAVIETKTNLTAIELWNEIMEMLLKSQSNSERNCADEVKKDIRFVCFNFYIKTKFKRTVHN